MDDYQTLKNNPDKETSQAVGSHSLTAKILHWSFIGVFIYGIIKQVNEVEQLEDFALLKFEMVFASIFLLLLIFRYAYMHATQPSVIPYSTPKIKKLIAKYTHLAMYVSLAMIAVTGLIIGALYWSGIKSGLAMNIAVGSHEISIGLSYFFIGLHVLAAIYHRLKRDGIWSSMVPFWKEEVK